MPVRPALREIDPSKTYRLLESGPVVLVVTHGGDAAVDDAREERRVLHHRGDGTFAADGEVFDLREHMPNWKGFQVGI